MALIQRFNFAAFLVRQLIIQRPFNVDGQLPTNCFVAVIQRVFFAFNGQFGLLAREDFVFDQIKAFVIMAEFGFQIDWLVDFNFLHGFEQAAQI